MELTTLHYFVAAAESNTLSDAARRVHVSQPAMSAALERLEDELGVRLIERRRGRGRLRMTRAGQRVLESARRVLREAERLRQDLLAWQDLRGGVLHIGAGTVAVEHFLPEPVAALTRRYPKLQVVLHEHRSALVLEGLVEGELDVGIVTGPSRTESVDLVARVEDPLIVVGSGQLTEHAGPARPIDEILAQHPLLSYGPSELQDQIDEALGQVGTAATRRLVIRSGEALKRYVAAGLGVGIVSQRGAARSLADGTLVEIPTTDLAIVRQYEVVRRREHLPAVDAFVDEVLRAWGATAAPDE